MRFHIRRNWTVWGILSLACLVAASGCSRMKYRLAADKEVKYLVDQKSNDPRWQLSNYTIGMDPRSRYFDPTDPDCPPMPYDDPAAHLYMHCVAGRKGYPCWHMCGDWYNLENPRWRELLKQYTRSTAEDAIILTQNGAVCLAQIHSDSYRTNIEQIYATALDLSTERFRFDVQFFGNSSTVFNHNGPALSPRGEMNTLTQTTMAGFNRNFSAGGELLVQFANSFVWQFAGPDTNATSSLLSFNFLQPLLRNGGRAFVLERLTRTERFLLYALRTFQRYRQGFYTNITVGNQGAGQVQSVTRQGGLTGGTGLTGFTGQGVNGLGGIGAITTGGGGQGGGGGGTAGSLGLAGGGAGGVGGFVGLVQQLQQVRNAQAVLDIQVRTLGLLEANLDAGLIDIVQVDAFRQNIETQRALLLSSQLSLQTNVENFKVQTLNLPPSLPMDLDDSLLKQFEFLDPRTTNVQHRIDDFVNMVGGLPAEPAPQELANALETLTKLREQLAEQFDLAQGDMQRMEQALPERRKSVQPQRVEQFDQDLVKLGESLADVQNRFNQTEAVLQNIKAGLPNTPPGRTTDEIVALATGMSGLTQELSLVKARARLETVTIPKIELEAERALDIARANRLDWMNSRAQLVDQWRLIAVNANQLRAGLDLTFSGNLGTIGNNAVAFNGQNGSMRVGVAFDAPFNRRLERNSYRLVLLQYQQQRRSLYQFQDGINFVLRNLLRTLAQLEINMEIQRRALVIAIRRVDKTREDLNKPPAPVQPGQQVELLGPTVATSLISALTDLQGAQNNFMSVVLNHYESRMLLYRELGIMELDDCGMWIDKPLNAADWLSEDQCPTTPEVPKDWMDEAGIDTTTEPGSDPKQPEAPQMRELERLPEVPPVLEPRSSRALPKPSSSATRAKTGSEKPAQDKKSSQQSAPAKSAPAKSEPAQPAKGKPAAEEPATDPKRPVSPPDLRFVPGGEGQESKTVRASFGMPLETATHNEITTAGYDQPLMRLPEVKPAAAETVGGN